MKITVTASDAQQLHRGSEIACDRPNVVLQPCGWRDKSHISAGEETTVYLDQDARSRLWDQLSVNVVTSLFTLIIEVTP